MTIQMRVPARTPDDSGRQDQLVKAASLLRRVPSMPNANVAQRFGLTMADVLQLRSQR